VTSKQDYAPNIAIFCDFENVALGAKDANFDALDIHLVLERLLDKGKIIVKKAYANWEHYKTFRRSLHESGFELIEIPHVSYSGKNSADIRMVVDALDLCFTKSHVDLFVIVSGDSDFSPLVGKLRENNKMVIGIGVKNSSSDLLIENCDEFIYYDDLVRDRSKVNRKPALARDSAERSKEIKDKPKESKEREKDKPEAKLVQPSESAAKKKASGEADAGSDDPRRKEEALEMVLDTVDRLFRERDDNVWGSMVKQTLKRKRPNFAETFHGYQSFNQLLEDAQKRGLLEIQKDEKSGGYIIVGFGPKA
jgi:uncharacterized protein (TIGR00288 family)